MTKQETSFSAFWGGPFSWPQLESENRLPPLPLVAGVYLQTFEYLDGYLIYAAGITRRPAPVRFKEHTRHYMNGEYNVLDVAAAQRGVREEVWHGWGYAREHRSEFEARKARIIEAVKRQLAAFRIFLADVGTERRLLERIEASIMNHLGQQPAPYCVIPDKGMMLAPRWHDEQPLLMYNHSMVKLYALPERLEV